MVQSEGKIIFFKDLVPAGSGSRTKQMMNYVKTLIFITKGIRERRKRKTLVIE